MAKLIRAAQMVGNKYNDLTVVAADGVTPRKARVRCDCGSPEFYAVPNEVRTGHTKSCGCRNRREQAEDRIGQKHGRLTIKARTPKKKNTEYRCLCDCGNEIIATWRNLRSGNTKSCGCLKQDHAGAKHYAWLPIEEVETRLAELAPKFTFPKLREEWSGTAAGNTLTVNCEKHGEFTHTLAKNGSANGLFRGQICFACGVESRQESNGKGISQGEQEVRDYVNTMLPTERGCLPGNRGWTFDIIIPEKKIAIEFNGVYWHSYPRAKRGQHLYKRKFAEQLGYRMITIWEDQWVDNQDRVKLYLKRVLQGAGKSIGGRKCRVTPIDRNVADAFHAKHHLQGTAPSVANQAFGLFLGEDLVGAASFDRHGALHRYTTGTLAIIGGLNKLCNAFFAATGANQIVTYCDRDHFTGAVYEKAGFEYQHYTLQLSYVENKRRVRRERYMKKKLAGLFGPEQCDMSKTEHEICADNHIWACYNSGIDKWVLTQS